MKMTHDQKIAIIQADKEGKSIKHRLIGTTGKWLSSTKGYYSFNFFKYEYRVEKEPRTLYVNESFGILSSRNFMDKDLAVEEGKHLYAPSLVEFKEVL